MHSKRARRYHVVMRSTPIPADLVNGWQQVLERWTDATQHDAVLGLAAKHNELAWLAGKYRDASRSNPADTVAGVRLAKVQRAAMIVTFTLPREVAAANAPKRRPYRAASMLLVGSVLAMGLGLVLTNQRVQSAQSAPAPTLVSRHP